jgi:nitrogen regulatory protein PII
MNFDAIIHSQPVVIVAIIAVFSMLTLLGVCMPFIMNWLAKKAEQIKSEKISLRVKDALKKLGIVVATLVDAEGVTLRKDFVEAIKDGNVSSDEINKMVANLSAKALEILKPELNTLKSYLAGDLILDYVMATVKSYIVSTVKEKLENPTTTPSQTK